MAQQDRQLLRLHLSGATTEAGDKMKTQALHDEALKSFNLVSIRNSAMAGYIAGVSGVILGHPLDSAKVWLQTNSAGSNKHLTKHQSQAQSDLPKASASNRTMGSSVASTTASSSASASSRPMHSSARSQVAKMSTLVRPRPQAAASVDVSFRTVRALYSGISGPLIAVGIVQSINFTIYDTLRRVLHRMDAPSANETNYLTDDSLKNVALAGFMTGSTLAFGTLPLVTIKVRQQVTGDSFREVLRQALMPSVGKGPNVSSLFSGFAPHFVSESFGRAAYYFTYESLKRSWSGYKRQHGIDSGPLHVQERMLCAAASGISCWTMIFPFDSVRSRMMTAASSDQEQRSTWQTVRHVYRSNGSSIRIFYRGFSLTLLRAGPVAAAVLPVYDYVLETLQRST